MPAEYFEARERALLGERYDTLYAAPQETAARGVTVSALRTTPEGFAARADFPLRPSPFCKAAFVVHQPDFKPGRHPYHHAGVFYSQEPSASSAAPLLGVQPGMRVLDLCAGTGCLGLGVKRFCPAAQVTCVEKSPAAFAYLEKNARCALTGQGRQTENVLEPSALEQANAPAFDWGPALNALRASKKPAYAVQPVQADLFTYWETLPEGQLELIVSNPPYLTAAEMEQLQPEVAQEPAMALEAGEDGLVFYKAIAEHYQKALRPGGALALEIGWQQREAVTALLEANGWADIACRKDFGGNDRCMIARRPG